jgi:hypothetical protein
MPIIYEILHQFRDYIPCHKTNSAIATPPSLIVPGTSVLASAVLRRRHLRLRPLRQHPHAVSVVNCRRSRNRQHPRHRTSDVLPAIHHHRQSASITSTSDESIFFNYTKRFTGLQGETFWIVNKLIMQDEILGISNLSCYVTIVHQIKLYLKFNYDNLPTLMGWNRQTFMILSLHSLLLPDGSSIKWFSLSPAKTLPISRHNEYIAIRYSYGLTLSTVSSVRLTVHMLKQARPPMKLQRPQVPEILHRFINLLQKNRGEDAPHFKI